MRQSLLLAATVGAALAALPAVRASDVMDSLDRGGDGNGGSGFAQKRGIGSTPVPGGGARERARRLAKLAKQGSAA
jgi:hypothetical protein